MGSKQAFTAVIVNARIKQLACNGRVQTCAGNGPGTIRRKSSAYGRYVCTFTKGNKALALLVS